MLDITNMIEARWLEYDKAEAHEALWQQFFEQIDSNPEDFDIDEWGAYNTRVQDATDKFQERHMRMYMLGVDDPLGDFAFAICQIVRPETDYGVQVPEYPFR